MSYYGKDLAWVHNVGYAFHAHRTAPGIIDVLRSSGIGRGDPVLDVGCGGGLLAAELLAAGFSVQGVDASEPMIALARVHAPEAAFSVLSLPTGSPAGAPRGLPRAKAVVSTGHVLNYLDDRNDIRRALTEVAQAVEPGGVIAIDLMTERYCTARVPTPVHAKVNDDWAIVTRFSRPGPYRFDRAITVFRLTDGIWHRSDEHHRNISFEADEAVEILGESGIQAQVRASFGDEQLTEGLVVLIGRARQDNAR